MKVFIRERRMERHMTQGELAAKLVNVRGNPLSQSDLSKYEKGQKPVPLDIAFQIAAVLGCRVEDLASRE